MAFLFDFLIAVWQSRAYWSLPSGCHCCAHFNSSSSQAWLVLPSYVIKKACKKLVSFLHRPCRASWLENGRKYLSRPYCANHFKGRLPSEDRLTHTEGMHSTLCSSQSTSGLSSCNCFPKASRAGSSLCSSSLLPSKEVMLWDGTAVVMSPCGFSYFAVVFCSRPQKCLSCTGAGSCAAQVFSTAAVGRRNPTLV